MPIDSSTAQALSQLHDQYAWLVNSAIAENREDVALELSDEYADDALRLIADARKAS